MPYTRKQVKLLLSDASPLPESKKTEIKAELHADPSMGHAKKGSAALKKNTRLTPDSAGRIRAKANSAMGKK